MIVTASMYGTSISAGNRAKNELQKYILLARKTGGTPVTRFFSSYFEVSLSLILIDMKLPDNQIHKNNQGHLTIINSIAMINRISRE